jgi:HSP20 family molecular chaperone IbpA
VFAWATPDGTERIQSRKVYIPTVDIVELDSGLQLISDMPGVVDQRVDVTIEKNILTIRDGVLRLTLPKVKQAIARNVAVTAG